MIRDKYQNKAKISGSLFLLMATDAIRFINDCISAGYHLCGLEGFLITSDGAYQPQQEHSNDIADTTLEHDAFVEATRRFLKSREDTEIWFEVVFSENDDT